MTTLSTQFCTPEQQAISQVRNGPLHCLTRDESIALAFVTQAGVLSTVACLLIYSLIIRNIRRESQRTPGNWQLIKVPMDIYLLSLFAADIVLSLSSVMNAKWVQDGRLYIGSWCSAQGVLLTVGSTTVALSTFAIAVHTFAIVWWNKGLHANFVATIAVSAFWVYGFVYATIIGALHHHESDSIFRPTPYWCWIRTDSTKNLLFGAYLWMWMALFGSILLYIPLFFWGRGNITVGDKPWSFKIHQQENAEGPGSARRRALVMIAYPVVYSFLILPFSVVRWIGFEHLTLNNEKLSLATISVDVIYHLSGLCNVLLFLLTRSNLLLFKKRSLEVTHNRRAFVPSSDADSIEGDREK